MQGPLTRAAILALATGASLASATALPTAASAQDYNSYQCNRERSGNTVAGAIIGGIAGAAIGNSVAGRGDRGTGTVVGGALGATVGAGVGSSSTRCYDAPSRYDYQRRDYDSRYDYSTTPSYSYDRSDSYTPSYSYDRSNSYTPSYSYDRSYYRGNSSPDYYQSTPSYSSSYDDSGY